MLTIKAMTGGETYAAHHLSNNDYYSVGETIEGQWMGRGAELLGLAGKVDLKHFEAIRQGCHPFTGEFLRQRHGADRVVEREVNGKTVGDVQKARNLYDFTISAPKDLSIQAMEDPRLIDAHNTAAAEAMYELERLASSRVRRAGANANRETGNLVIAQYNHDTSRELDPQIHTHFVAGNLTYDGAEGRWKALQASQIYAEREYLTEVYRNRLAREVTNRGYQVEDRFDHGKDNGFGILGIKETTREKFSRRSAQRDQAIQDFLDNNGRLPSNNEIARLVRDTRPEKLTEVTTAEVKAQQRARLDAEEARTLKDLHQTAREKGPVSGEVWERLAALDKEERRIQLDRRGLAYVTRELSERIAMPMGERDPYWETWYEAHGRPLEESSGMGTNPKLFDYINALNDLYETWRAAQVAADSAKLDGFHKRLDDLNAREVAVLKERLSLKVAVYERTKIAGQDELNARAMSHAGEHIFERVSVAKEYELKTEALRYGRGRVELPALKAVLQAEIASGAMLSAHGEVATKESLKRERRMVETIDEGIGQYQPLHRGHKFLVSDRLRPEQKIAVLAVLNSQDLAFNLRGAAGTGKTATLQELHRGLHESRRSAVAVAPTASAVEELQKVGFSCALTVARLLADPQQRAELAGQVLIVDEAGMISSKDMAALLDLAKDKGARIVFSGDTAQLKSVSEGDALRVLERESKLKSVSLLQVQRQTNAEYKAAVETLRNHPAEGYAKLEAMGAIREVDWRLRAQEVSKAYREAAQVPNVKGDARSVLVVAATHDEIKSVTYAIRQHRKRAGEIGDGKTFVQHSPLNWTEAQKKQTKNYRPGQILEFHKQVKGVEKNEALEVVHADKSGITARKADGKTLTLSRRQAQAFAVFEKQEIEVSAGDKLLLQANWRDRDFKATNGELVTVARVEEGRIQLEDGRQMPAAYRQFSHGYAVTAHRSQGKTVDYEIIAAEQMAQDLFYVSVTRAREGVTVITSDSQALQESIGVSGDRQSASELERRTASAARGGVEDFRLYEAQSGVIQQLQQQKGLKEERNAHTYSAGIGV